MSRLNSDADYMTLALREAKKGWGRTSPNPCVGAVIVKDGEVIASGYHEKAGTPHAEIHALKRAGEKALGATMYVTLEPCNHTGRTPPCSHAVVNSGIKRVVIGMLDPNPLVAGSGKQYLLTHEIEVETGILEQECRLLNEPFIKYITSGRPLVTLKAGVSLDGRLNYQKGRSGWITGAESSARVHQLRDYYDAILVGRSTVAVDNPSLTTRLEDGAGKDPVRIVLDSNLSLPLSAKVFTQDSNSYTWVFCADGADPMRIEEFRAQGVKVTQVPRGEDNQIDLASVLDSLAKQEITSLLVEGGGAVHSSFLRKKLADKANLFYAPLFAGSDGEALISALPTDSRNSAIRLVDIRWTELGEDILIEGNVRYPQGNKE